MERRIRLNVAVCFLFFLSAVDSVIIGQTTRSYEDLDTFLLGRIKDNRNKIKNFKCRVIYYDFSPEEAARRQVENLRRKLGGKLSENGFRKFIGELNSPEQYKYQKHKLAFDNEGRARVEMILGISDAKDSLVSVQSKHISTWDGEDSINYTDRAGKRRATLNKKQPAVTAKEHRQPWYMFGGNFYDQFAKTIADGNPIDVKQEEDGTYSVELLYAENRKLVGVIDPSQGFSVILHESYSDGQLVARYKAKFTETSPNVWFPVEGEFVAFSKGAPPQLALRSKAKVSEIIVNDPNFYDGLFHVDFPEGTVVRDAISGYQYVVGEPMSEKPDGSSKSLHEVAMDTLEEMAKENNQKHQEVELFIPKVNLALERNEPFVLSIPDGKLLNPRNKPESKESNRFLTERGKGDIAWDGMVIATRGSKVLSIKQESRRPVKLTKGKWTSSGKLPDKVELPYSMLVVTRERANFLMSIRKIEPGGITVVYRQLNPDELSRYEQ